MRTWRKNLAGLLGVIVAAVIAVVAAGVPLMIASGLPTSGFHTARGKDSTVERCLRTG